MPLALPDNCASELRYETRHLPDTARWPFILRPTDGDTSSTGRSGRSSRGEGMRRGDCRVLLLCSWSLQLADTASTTLSIDDERESCLWFTSHLKHSSSQLKCAPFQYTDTRHHQVYITDVDSREITLFTKKSRDRGSIPDRG
jgi:hypothetical protein